MACQNFFTWQGGSLPPPPLPHTTTNTIKPLARTLTYSDDSSMPPAKRSRQRYTNRRRNGGIGSNRGINTYTRTAPANQMSNYLSRNDPFPAVEYATLRYTRQIKLTPQTQGFVAHNSFRATSIFDPDYTNLTVGGQPYGHDTYASIYHHYKVLKAHCTIVGMPSSNQDFPGYGIQMDDDASFTSTPQNIMSAKGSTYVLSGTGGRPAVLSRTYNCNMLPDQSLLSAEMGANPAQDFFFRPFTLTDDTNRSVDMVVTIIYRVKMWGLKGLSVV